MNQAQWHPSPDSLCSIDVHELLPQQEPFVMIGQLVELDEAVTVTRTTIAPHNLMVEDGHFTAAGIIENIAQTCAARIGYVNKYILQRGIQIGYIGAVRDLAVVSLPQVGATITTRVTVLEQVMGMTLAQATVACDGREIASTQMKIAVQEGEQQQ